MASITPIIIVRYSLVLLFMWFGFHQLFNPEVWVVYLPEFTKYIPIPVEMLVRLNGWFEVVFAIALVLGLCTRFVSALLGLHLLGIAWSAGGAIGIRDAVLGLCTLALIAGKPDAWTMDSRKESKKQEAF